MDNFVYMCLIYSWRDTPHAATTPWSPSEYIQLSNLKYVRDLSIAAPLHIITSSVKLNKALTLNICDRILTLIP